MQQVTACPQQIILTTLAQVCERSRFCITFLCMHAQARALQLAIKQRWGLCCQRMEPAYITDVIQPFSRLPGQSSVEETDTAHA